MSYYYKHKYGFSTHALQRIQQRLNLKEKEEFIVKDKIIKMINNPLSQFDTSSHTYFEVKKELFLVVKKGSNTIVTCSPISPTRQLWLIENE